MWQKVVRAAQNLQMRGYKPRQNFGFMANNSDDVAPIFLASICLSCPVVPLHTMLAKEEIVRFLGKPVVIFCDSDAHDQLNDAMKELKLNAKVFIFGKKINGLESVGELFKETGDEENFESIIPDVKKDVAGIVCSSGTTGPSKYTCLPYEYQLFQPIPYEEDNVILSFDSIYWTAGMKPIMDTIHNGATRIITTKPFSPELQLKIIEKYKVTILFNSPPNTVGCLKSDLIHKADLTSVRIILSFGCRVPNDLVLEIKRFFPNARVVSSYGMTEIGVVSISLLDGSTASNMTHILPGRLVKIVDENGNNCGPNMSGEICARVKHPFLGYLDDPAANEAAFDEEGYFRTGDIGYFDENGALFFEDRKKNVIKVFYFRGVFLPNEIEDFLMKMPDINDVCIVGVPVAFGYALPAALVVRKANSNLSQRDVYNMIAEKFPNRAKPRAGVYFVDSLPKTPSGKSIRREITKIATEMFKTAKKSDPDVLSFLAEIPEEFRKLI